MSDYILVESNVIQTITDYTTNIVSSTTKVREPIISSSQGPQGPPGVSAAVSVGTLQDVDLSSLADGSLLIYSSSSQKWKASTILEKQALECGQY